MEDKSWLVEFQVTSHTRHAVQALRAAIPRRGDIEPGGEGITVTLKHGIMTAMSARVELPEIDPTETATYEDLDLTMGQRAAAEFLLSMLAYHAFLLEEAYGVPNSEEIRVFVDSAVLGRGAPEGLLSARNRLVETLSAELNMSAGMLDHANENSVTIWS